MVKCADSILYRKAYSAEEKIGPEFHPTWKKGTFPISGPWSFCVISSKRKMLKSTCDC